MTTFMAPPPASTFLAFHPQDNNILAIGMEDSTIHIYNVRVDEVINLSIILCLMLWIWTAVLIIGYKLTALPVRSKQNWKVTRSVLLV